MSREAIRTQSDGDVVHTLYAIERRVVRRFSSQSSRGPVEGEIVELQYDLHVGAPDGSLAKVQSYGRDIGAALRAWDTLIEGWAPPRPTALDLRRLRDGDTALTASAGVDPPSMDDMTLRALRLIVVEGATALQSTDDLGSPEANEAAGARLTELERRLAAIDAELAKRGPS